MRTRKKSFLALVIPVVALLVITSCAPVAPSPTPSTAPPTTAALASPKPAETTAAKPAATPSAAASKPTGAPIKIGYLTALSGRAAQAGLLQRIASVMAEEDINKAGGINGSPVQIITDDSPFDPKQAVTMVRKQAEQDKVLAIVGPYSTGEFEVAAPLANELQVPVIGTIATKPGITASNRPWSFRVVLTDDLIYPSAIDTFKKQYPSIKKMVIAGDTKESVSENNVKNVLPPLLKDKGYEVLGTVSFETGTTDFSAIITKIKELNPEGIAYDSLGPEALGFAKELERQGVKAPAVTGTRFWVGPYVAQAGTAMEGWITAPWFDADSPDANVQQWVTRYKGLAEADTAIVKPVFVTVEAHHYDTLQALADIMRKAGIRPDTPLQEARTKIRDALQTLKDYKGLAGAINMGSNGDATWKPLPGIAKGGKWVVIR